MAIPDDPGVDDTGYPSSFTRQQLRSLREIWRILLGVMDGSYQRGNPELTQKGSIEIDGDENADSGKGAFKGQPTNDNEKAKKRRELDRKMTEQMLSTLTPEELRDITWRTCMADSFDSLSWYIVAPDHGPMLTSLLIVARFGRARDWDVEATVAMLGASAAWRHKMKIPQLLEAGDIDQGGYKHGLGDKPADPKEAKRLMKKYQDGYSYCCGTDRAGRPIVVVNVSLRLLPLRAGRPDRLASVAQLAAHRIGSCSYLTYQRFLVSHRTFLRVDHRCSFEITADPGGRDGAHGSRATRRRGTLHIERKGVRVRSPIASSVSG